jgi:hypothetical protein
MAEFDPSYLRHSFIHQFHGAAMALMGRPPTIICQVFKLWGRKPLPGFHATHGETADVFSSGFQTVGACWELRKEIFIITAR